MSRYIDPTLFDVADDSENATTLDHISDLEDAAWNKHHPARKNPDILGDLIDALERGRTPANHYEKLVFMCRVPNGNKKLTSRHRAFASELYQTDARLHYKLTLKQLEWVDRIYDHAINGYPNAEKTPEKKSSATGTNLGNLVPVVNLLQETRDRGLRYPKLFFKTENGHRVKVSLNSARSKYPGSLAVTDGGPYGQNRWYGNIDPKGGFFGSRYNPEDIQNEVISLLTALAADPSTFIAENGKKSGNCACCGRPLSDDKTVGPDGKTSLQRGVGPVCAKKWNLC